MHRTLVDLLDRSAGVVSRRQALACVSEHALQWALRSGAIVRVAPGWYVRSTDDQSLATAAARYAGDRGALSHTTALWQWGCLTQLRRPLHITVPADRQPRGSALVTAHRSYRPAAHVQRNGLTVTSLERSLLESAPLLSPDLRRWVLIESVRQRITTTDRLHSELAGLPTLRTRTRLLRLVELLATGCRSELELFGYTRVFRCRGMPALVGQYALRLRKTTVYLDLADPELRLAIEMDGAEFHDNAVAIERDRRRDVELAALGWLVLRFSTQRLRRDPAGVRHDVLAVVARRQTQLRAS